MDQGREVTEWDAAEELTKYRAPLENFAGVRAFRPRPRLVSDTYSKTC